MVKTEKNNNTLAIITLILGVGLFMIRDVQPISLVVSIPALLIGAVALSKKQNEAMTLVGMTMAAASIVFVVYNLMY